MSERFMKVKRVIIPTLTLAIMLGQVGCCLTENELLQMIKKGEQVEIQIEVPENIEQGIESALIWTELAYLETDNSFRAEWDELLGITGTIGDKNGMLYVNVDGKQENNNTLRVALHNKAFVDRLSDEKLANALNHHFIDVEDCLTDKVYMGILRYFNLLQGTEDGYINPSAILTRAEAMAMIMRAETPVDDTLEVDTSFIQVVGNSKYNLYAQHLQEYTYLNLEDKSLNNKTYNGYMSRLEYVYMIINKYFAEELGKVDITKVEFIDAKDGGNIAEQQGFVDYDYCRDYEMVYMLQDTNVGVTTELYKALVVAYNKGLIGEETRFDESITVSEAVEILVNALIQENGMEQFTSLTGSNSENTSESESALAEEVITVANSEDPFIIVEKEIEEKVEPMGQQETEQEIVEQQETEQEQHQEVVEQAPAYEVEALNKTMYATSSVNLRKGPSTDYSKVGSLSYAEKVKVIGVVRSYKGEPCLWYQLSSGEFVSGNYLSDNKPQQTITTKKENNSSSNKKEESTDKTQGNNNKDKVSNNKQENSNNKKEDDNDTKKDSPFKVDPNKCGDIEYGGGGKGAEGGGSAYNDVTFN